jgi:hypothetical protein
MDDILGIWDLFIYIIFFPFPIAGVYTIIT